MSTHDGFSNPTTAAAAMNEGYAWPDSLQAPAGNMPSRAGEATQVHLGGQAPMFVHADAADPGLVRLGGQSPLF